MIAVEFLWVSGLGDRSAGDTTAVHLPPVPLSCDTGRDLENELQGPSGVAWSPPIIRLSRQSCHMRKDRTLSSIFFGFGVIRWDKFLKQFYCPCKSKFCVEFAVLDRHHSVDRSCF